MGILDRFGRQRTAALAEQVSAADARVSAVSEQLQTSLSEIQRLVESTAELELALDDVGWTRLLFDSELEFSRDGLRKIVELARTMYVKNPLINRAVNIKSIYVWGQGATVTAADERAAEFVADLVADRGNQRALFGQVARSMREIGLQHDGNLFFALFSDRLSSGATNFRRILVDEITDIVANPDDRDEPRFYIREWTVSGVPQIKAYPAWDYRPKTMPGSVQWQGRSISVDGTTPLYHVRIGGTDAMRFGLPEVYAALDWARAHTDYLADFKKLAKSLSRWAWNLSVANAGEDAIAAVKAKINSTLSDAASETNPAPVTGGVALEGEDVDLQPMRFGGAAVRAEDERYLKLMVASATGLPETFFGDADVGNHATSKTLDRPTELMFADRQTLWAGVWADLLGYAVTLAAGAANSGIPKDVDPTVQVTFPPILQSDPAEVVKAWVAAATLGGQTPTAIPDMRWLAGRLLQALGEDDVEQTLIALFGEAGSEPPTGDDGEGDED